MGLKGKTRDYVETLQIPCHPAQKRQAIVPQADFLGDYAPKQRDPTMIRTMPVRKGPLRSYELN